MDIPSFTVSQLESAAPGRPTAVTIGVMDGVHLGHQYLVDQLRREAAARDLSPGVVTLYPHPVTVLRPDSAPSYLCSLEERLTLLREAGADWAVPLIFSSDVAELTAEDLTGCLADHLGMRLLVLGPDARFGRGAPKDTADRVRAFGQQAGFEVVQIETLVAESGQRYSSSAIRDALGEGNLDVVTQLLGRPYSLSGPVVRGFERGRTIGFPTANLSLSADRALPALGVYATRATIDGVVYPGATNVGRRPTFDAGHISVETHVLAYEGDLYGKRITVAFEHRIRPEVKFSGPEELVAQIARDVETARSLLQ
jgi:riboflavin kinase/FMN adenylyltransferase